MFYVANAELAPYPHECRLNSKMYIHPPKVPVLGPKKSHRAHMNSQQVRHVDL